MFELALATTCVDPCGVSLGIDQLYWAVFVGVGGASAAVVGFDSGFEVCGHADVEGVVPAAEDVDVEHGAPFRGD